METKGNWGETGLLRRSWGESWRLPVCCEGKRSQRENRGPESERDKPLHTEEGATLQCCEYRAVCGPDLLAGAEGAADTRSPIPPMTHSAGARPHGLTARETNSSWKQPMPCGICSQVSTVQRAPRRWAAHTPGSQAGSAPEVGVQGSACGSGPGRAVLTVPHSRG